MKGNDGLKGQEPANDLLGEGLPVVFQGKTRKGSILTSRRMPQRPTKKGEMRSIVASEG